MQKGIASETENLSVSHVPINYEQVKRKNMSETEKQNSKIIDLNSARNVLNHKRPQAASEDHASQENAENVAAHVASEGADQAAERTSSEGAAAGNAPDAGAFTKQNVLRRLQEAERLYSLLSLCTRSPYVQCDPETYDDEIFLFFDEDTAKAEAKRLLEEEQQPAGAVRIDNAQKLPFFSSLFTMGVNAFLVKEGEQVLHFQLEELVKRREPEGQKEGVVRVENPSLLLTALYYAQEIRRHKTDEADPKVRALQEEMLADFRRGTFIMAVEKETKNTPLLKVGEDLFHPVFTDIEEFKKFDREQKFLAAVVPAKEIPKHIAPNAKGVIINPIGVNLVLNLGRPQANAAKAQAGAAKETPQGRIADAEAASIAAAAIQAAAAAGAPNADGQN